MNLGTPSESHLSRFNTGTIGPEPAGATPIADEDLEGLIPTFVATRADLNQVEFENIAKAMPRALRRATEIGPEGVLDFNFLLALHRSMFEDVWKWAGTLRRRVTNIGIDPDQIIEQSRLMLDDARYWYANGVFDHAEIALRVHCRLVTIHQFPNGNGRATRLLADLFLVSIDRDPLPWGRSRLDVDGRTRKIYIASLVKAATTGYYDDLISFAQSGGD